MQVEPNVIMSVLQYRVRNLEPVTSYNVTVNAVSHNSATVQSGNYITVRTGANELYISGDFRSAIRILVKRRGVNQG